MKTLIGPEFLLRAVQVSDDDLAAAGGVSVTVTAIGDERARGFADFDARKLEVQH